MQGRGLRTKVEGRLQVAASLGQVAVGRGTWCGGGAPKLGLGTKPSHLGSREREEEKDGKGRRSPEVPFPSPPAPEPEFSRSEVGPGDLYSEGSAAPSFRKRWLSCKLWTKIWGRSLARQVTHPLRVLLKSLLRRGPCTKEFSTLFGTW